MKKPDQNKMIRGPEHDKQVHGLIDKESKHADDDHRIRRESQTDDEGGG